MDGDNARRRPNTDEIGPKTARRTTLKITGAVNTAVVIIIIRSHDCRPIKYVTVERCAIVDVRRGASVRTRVVRLERSRLLVFGRVEIEETIGGYVK